MVGWFNTPGGPSFPELVRQCLSSIEGGYDLLAEKFDHSVFRTPNPILDGLQNHFHYCRSALDIGCGSGAVLQRLQPFVQELIGQDLSSQMLEQARQHLNFTVQLWQADFLRTYWENRFDLITCLGAMGHIAPERQQEFFQGVYRALRPGGIFLTVVGDLRGRPDLYLLALLFDTMMRLRNLLWRPTFIMYYLSFILPEAQTLLKRQGFHCQILSGNFPSPFSHLKILKALRPH